MEGVSVSRLGIVENRGVHVVRCRGGCGGAISPGGKFPVTWAHRTDHTHDTGRSWGDESSTIAYTRRHRID